MTKKRKKILIGKAIRKTTGLKLPVAMKIAKKLSSTNCIFTVAELFPENCFIISHCTVGYDDKEEYFCTLHIVGAKGTYNGILW